jgi:hypothetical protein
VSFYEGETLDEALQTAAEGFCEDDANVDVVANKTTNKTTVRLSKLFSWYRGDFGASDAEVLERVQDWCPRGSAKKEALLTSLTALANTVNDDARKKIRDESKFRTRRTIGPSTRRPTRRRTRAPTRVNRGEGLPGRFGSRFGRETFVLC